jgi:hypothetical protein
MRRGSLSGSALRPSTVAAHAGQYRTPTEIWSLTWAKDGRALFRFGREITPGETHIICEAIGTHAETYGRMK